MSPACPRARDVQERLDSTPLADLRRLIEPAVAHALGEGCRDCAAALRALHQVDGCRAEAGEASWPAEPRLEARAPRIAAKLVDMPAARRRIYLLESRAACTRPVIEELLAQARARLSIDAEKAVEIAELAVFCADNIRPGHYEELVWSDIQAMALTVLGGAHRRNGDLRAAADALEEAEAAASLGTYHPAIVVGLLEKKGWLAIDRGHHEGALDLLSESYEIAVAAGGHHLRGRCLYSRAAALELLGRYREAVADLHDAALFLDVEREPRLGFGTLLALARCRAAEGLHRQAIGYLERAEERWASFINAGDRIRLTWERGRIHAASGEPERARRCYARACAGFVELDYPFDAALVELELAATLAEEGRFAEVAELAAEILEIFRATGVVREAVAAVHLLREAQSVEAVRRATAVISRLQAAGRSSPPRR